MPPKTSPCSSNAQQNDQTSQTRALHKFIRVGRYHGNEDQDEGESESDDELRRENIVPYRQLVVAEVVSKDIEFMIVDTWMMNEVLIGYCEYGLSFKPGPSHKWEPDEPFASTCGRDVARLKSRILDIATGKIQNDSLGLPSGVGYNKVSEPLPQIVSARTEDVNVVILFGNETGVKMRLDLPINLQAVFPPYSTFEAFKKYIMEGDLEHPDDYRGLIHLLKDKEIGEWDCLVSVLPQKRQSKTAYSWNTLDHYWISRWLDEDLCHNQQYKRFIYVEVDILPKNDMKHYVPPKPKPRTKKTAKTVGRSGASLPLRTGKE